MNKRILKIFNEAGFHQPEMERLGIEHKFEKFVELILIEVIATIYGSDIKDKKQDKLVDKLLYKFGMK